MGNIHHGNQHINTHTQFLSLLILFVLVVSTAKKIASHLREERDEMRRKRKKITYLRDIDTHEGEGVEERERE